MNPDNRIKQLETEIAAIKQRNLLVEGNKAWETSLERRILIAVLTYLVVTTFFFAISAPQPFVNAIVPTMGFLLSTLSIDFAKRAWLKRRQG